MSVAVPFTLEKMKPLMRWTLAVMVLGLTVPMSGCLTRQAGPSLPYVKPANSVVQTDPVPVHLVARMQDMEVEMQRLRDLIERRQSAGAEDKEIRNLQERVAFIEKQLGIEPSPAGGGKNHTGPAGNTPRQGPAKPENPTTDKPPASTLPGGHASPVEIISTPLPPDEKAYREAYSALKSGSPDQSIRLFEEFLTTYPKSEFVSNAVYWMGEARYSQGRFDEAVLQFDRVIKEFPGSKKELSSLLRQGQAFEKMGDSRSAKIIFQRIMDDYPHTAQARVAAGRIKALPTQ